MSKYLVIIVASVFLVTSCKTDYRKGIEAGFASTYQDNYDDAYSTGNADGQIQGQFDGESNGYNTGFNTGYNNGWSDAFDTYASNDYVAGYGNGAISGYNQGYSDGHVLGTSNGQSDGYSDGMSDSYNNHYNSGYNSGYSAGDYDGYYDGYNSSYNSGYYSGYNSGANNGYGDGYDDGYYDGLGNSASKNPAIALASKVNSDLVNYAALPKFNKDTAMSAIALNHADGGSVDLEKLSALKEQFYINAIKNQISARFGVSLVSALKIANVVHQFNKSSNSRELTTEDASSFSKNLVGFDMNSIEKAVKKSAKGESNDLKDLAIKAAGNLEMSPENFNNMITTIFF